MQDQPSPSQIQLNHGAVSLSYDPQKWGNLENDKDGIVTLDRLTGEGCASIIAERVGIPAETAVDNVLEEVKKKHPDLEVLVREKRMADGREVCCLKYVCTISELSMMVYMYCYGGLAGTVQVRTCVRAACFDECEPDFTELLGGLAIRKSQHPGLARVSQGLGFAGRVTILAAPALGIGLFRFLLRMAWQMALLWAAVLTVGFFLFAWVYDLVKYKLRE